MSTPAALRAQSASMWVNDAALLKTLDSLTTRHFGTVIRSASNKAMTPVVKKARRNLKSESAFGTGLLSRSLGKKAKFYKGSSTQIVVVGPRHNFREQVTRQSPWGARSLMAKPANYAHLVERGHRGRGRNRRGITAGKPFIEPALRSEKPTVLRSVRVELGVGILKRWQKAK